MKNFKFSILILMCFCAKTLLSQKTGKQAAENYGSVLNAGIGVGYYGYVGYTLPVLHADYEIQIFDNITFAPSISMYKYSGKHVWVNQSGSYRNYSYNETVVPLGLKVYCYLDKFLRAGPKWDFYSAGSLGFIVRKTQWESEYGGATNIEPGTGPLYLDFHLGSEFHLNSVVGLQLDLSTGVSTFGFAIHL